MRDNREIYYIVFNYRISLTINSPDSSQRLQDLGLLFGTARGWSNVGEEDWQEYQAVRGSNQDYPEIHPEHNKVTN